VTHSILSKWLLFVSIVCLYSVLSVFVLVISLFYWQCYLSFWPNDCWYSDDILFINVCRSNVAVSGWPLKLKTLPVFISFISTVLMICHLCILMTCDYIDDSNALLLFVYIYCLCCSIFSIDCYSLMMSVTDDDCWWYLLLYWCIAVYDSVINIIVWYLCVQYSILI
jgi:hypothetical protein